ncbi:host specificity factor TipJ family phage tail protein [Halomonas elongata]|uniref:host specificity factor TipJ family phage tail protein n=1 Tax=Halomonas elongata TaxID=2746 RepID=UPI00255AAA87|nr:host specificity factor TipJ family phage tail protein [Halomonas elongata]MDL4860819.1 host specificity factor TipJ family phage tail protein [Halomonas elongata]
MTTIVARPSPVRNDLYTAEIPDGTSLSVVLGDMPENVRAQIDGEVLPRGRWAEPLPADAQVLITGTPEDDGIGRAIAMIAVAVASAYTGGAAAAAMGFTKGTAAFAAASAATSAAVTVAGTLAVNALIPPEMPSEKSPTSPNVRNSITGTRNQIDKYGVVPRVYGNPRWYPKLAANPVTEIAGNDQFLRMLLVLGYGPLEVAGHRVGDGYSVLKDANVGDAITIGETNLGDYEDVEWEIGMSDQLTLMTPDIAEEQVGVALNAQGDPQADTWVPDGNSATRTTAPGTKEISIDLVGTQGLFSVNDNGTDSLTQVEFKVEYREAGTSAWTVQDDAWLIKGPTKDTLRLNKRWAVPKGQYDVRVTRVRSYHGGVQAIYTDCQWSVLRSVQDGPAYTGNHVLMALRIRATDQLNGVIDQLRIRTQAVLRVWDGSAWVMQATNNPGWAYIDAMTGQQVGNPIGDDRLHLEDIVNWAAFCDAHASPLEYHHVHDGDETVLDRARSIAAAGQGSFAFRDGKFGIVFDDSNTPTVQAITPRNASGFSSSIQYKDLPHGIRVKYVDPDTWSDAERIVYRDGYDESNATRFEDFQLQGVASSEEAWNHGNYHLRQAILRPETFKASMDWENLAIVRGNRVLYQYDAILVGLGSARVKSVSGTTIVLDERLEYTEQRAYGISVRGVDDAAGKAKLIATQVTGAEIGETDTFTSVDSIDVEPGDLVIYGVMGKESIDAKVTRIEPNEDFGADLTLVNAAPDIYDYTTAPVFDPGITNPIPPDRVRPPVPHITSVRGDETAAQQNQDGSFTTLIRVAYAFNTQVGLPNLQVEARYRVVGSDEWEHAGPFTTSGNLTIRDVDEELDYEIQLRALNGSMASVWSQTATLTVTGQAVQVPQSIEVQRGNFSITLIPHGLYAGAQYEFWRSSAPLALGDVETSAQRLSVGAVLVDTDLMPDTTYYYYVRQWTVARVSEFATVEATTKNDPSAIISNISGEIHEGVLDPALRERVEQVGINEDSIAQTQKDLADEAERLDDRADTIQGNLDDEAARLDGRVSSVQNSLESTRNNLEAADADLDQRLDEAETAIVEEVEARRTEDEFVATRLEGLQDTSDKHDLRIGELQRVQQEGDALDAIMYEALNAETANRRASIRTEERVRIDGDSALAMRADSLEASVGDLDAALTTEQQARADEDSALASQIGELSAKVDALPQFASGFESGSDFDQWTVAGGSTLNAETDNVYVGLQSGLVTSADSSPNPWGTDNAVYVRIPAGATEAFEGFEIAISIAARQPDTNAAAEFAVAYSTDGAGNSGWQHFTPDSTWNVFEFTYTVPEGASGSRDILRIWGDTSGAGLGVIIDAVRVKRVAGEIQEITAALQQEQQARIDGDDALASDLQNMDARVGDVESGLTEEQQTRASADSAMASDIQDIDARVGGVESGLTTEQQVRADKDEALASRASSLEARADDVEAGLASERQTRASADEALASDLSSMDARVGDTESSIIEEAEVRATEDEAQARTLEQVSLNNQQQSAAISALQRVQQEGDQLDAIIYEALNAETANRRASIRTEERVRTDEDSALAIRADQLKASVDDLDAAVAQEQQAWVDGDNALASNIETVQTQLGEDIASVEQTAQANIDAQAERIDALWTLRVDVNGRVTGIGLHNDGQQSEFGVIADRMYIVDPDDPATADVPFIFDNGRLLLKEALIDQLTFGKLTDGSGNFVVDSDGRIKADYLQLSDALEVGGGSDELITKRNWEDGDRGTWREAQSQIVGIAPAGISFPVPYTRALELTDRQVFEEGSVTPCSPGDKFNLYTISNAYWANGPAGIGLRFRDADGNVVGWESVIDNNANWKELSKTVTAPANAADATPWLYISAPWGETGQARFAYASIRRADNGVTRVSSSGVQIFKPNGDRAVNISPAGSDFSGNVNVEGLTVNNYNPSFVTSGSYGDNNSIHYVWGQPTTDGSAPNIPWRSQPDGISFYASSAPYNGDTAETYINLIDVSQTVNGRGPSSSAFINLDVDLQYFVRTFLSDSDRSVARAEFDGELLIYDGGDLVRRSVIVHQEDSSREFNAVSSVTEGVNTSTTAAIKLKEADGNLRIVFRLRAYCYTQRYADGHNATFIFESRRCEMDALISRI